MSEKNLLCVLGGMILGALALDMTVGAGVKKGAEPAPRCPCVDPTPDKANISPSKFCSEFGLHVCAFHIGKDDPKLQVEAHHYCTPLRDGVFQCVIYDKDKGNAKLIGVEYVVSDDIYKTLLADEKKLWHPHEYEIRAGLLTLPGIPADCEKKLLTGLLKSWGKVWHTWPDPTTELPIGAPVLMWSSTSADQVRKDLVKSRDERFKIDTEEIRKQRAKIFEASR